MFKIGKFSNSIAINDEKKIIVVITNELTLMEYENNGKDWNKVRMQKIQINDDAKIRDLCINSMGDQLSILTNKNLQIWVKRYRQLRWQRLRTFRFYLQFGESIKLEASFQQQQVVNQAIVIFDTQPLLIKIFTFSLINRHEKLIHVKTDVAQVYSVSNTLELIAKNLFDNDQIHFINYRNIQKQYQILISESNLFKMCFSEKNQLVVVLVNKINIYQFIDNYFVIIESINLLTNLLNKIFLNYDLCQLVGIFQNYYAFKSNQEILIFDVKTQKYYEQKKQKAKVIMSQNRGTALIEVSFRHRGHGKHKKYQFRLLYLNHFADYLLIEQNPEGFLFF